MLDGFVAGGGLRDVNRSSGDELRDEPAIVGFSGFAMRDDGCPADAEVGHEVCRRNLLPIVVKAFADRDSEFDFFVGVHGYWLSVRVATMGKHPIKNTLSVVGFQKRRAMNRIAVHVMGFYRGAVYPARAMPTVLSADRETVSQT